MGPRFSSWGIVQGIGRIVNLAQLGFYDANGSGHFGASRAVRFLSRPGTSTPPVPPYGFYKLLKINSI